MNKESLTKLLTEVQSQNISVGAAVEKLQNLPFEDLGFAKIDHHRALRRGFPEVIFCENKTPAQVATLFSKMDDSETILATRASRKIFAAVSERVENAEFNETGRTIVVNRKSSVAERSATTLVCCAGTSDIPVAEEAAVTAEAMGQTVERLYDVGVAGLHRLLDSRKKLAQADALVVVAGMDGALPTVVSGLVDKPVIAVPTSVGYGSSFAGVAPLLTMLNACSPGIVVVNIDNGFGAGYFAALITRSAWS